MLSRREHDFAGNRSSRRDRAKKTKAAGDDENSRYALAEEDDDDDDDDGGGVRREEIMWEGNEARGNSGKYVCGSRTCIRSYLDRGAANRRAGTRRLTSPEIRFFAQARSPNRRCSFSVPLRSPHLPSRSLSASCFPFLPVFFAKFITRRHSYA